MSDRVQQLEAFLGTHGIGYQRVDHPPVYTCEEARRLLPAIEGAETKNLFLRDGKGSRHFLVSVSPEKSVDLKALSTVLEVKGLSFGSPDRLQRILGIEPGSVTLLAVFLDQAGAVEVIIDAALWSAVAVLCHPLINTATLSLRHDDLARFLSLTSHSPRVIDVPATGSRAD